AYGFQLVDVTDPIVTPSGFVTVYSGNVTTGTPVNIPFAANAGTPIYIDSQDLDRDNAFVRITGPGGFDSGNLYLGFSDPGRLLLPRSGNYAATVTSSSGASNYSFRLLDLNAASPLSLGTPVSSTFAGPYVTDVYKFTGLFGQRLFYDPTDNDSDNVV